MDLQFLVAANPCCLISPHSKLLNMHTENATDAAARILRRVDWVLKTHALIKADYLSVASHFLNIFFLPRRLLFVSVF